MTKELEEMTLEELWQLFPIQLVAHQDEWAEWYEEEKRNLLNFLDPILRIEHIGSTAIPDIWAKPIVDIIVIIDRTMDRNKIKQQLIDHGYRCMFESKERMSFNKGYTKYGFDKKVFHLHLRYEGDDDEIYFRDYLIAHKEIAKEYEKLKLSLWKPYEHDRDGYTNAKTAFVQKYSKRTG